MRQTLILLFLSLAISFIGQAQESTDTIFILDESNRIVKKILDKQIVEEIEYPSVATEVVADAETYLPILNKSAIYAYDFNVGDTVRLEVQPVGRITIAEIALLNSEGGAILKAVKLKRTDTFDKQIIIQQAGSYTLSIKSDLLWRGRVKFKITRRPQSIPISYRVVRDTIFYPKADSVISVDLAQKDTLLYQLADYNTLVHNRLDLEQSSRISIPILFPTEIVDSSNYFFYWIGLSQTDTLQYLSLNTNFDFSTLQSELITPAVAAYGLNWDLTLPKTNNANVSYQFTDLLNKTLFKRKSRVKKVIIGQVGTNPPNFGRIPVQIIRRLPTIEIDGTTYKQLFLNVANQSKVMTYPVQLKITGMGIKSTYENTIVKRIKTIRTYKIKIE